MTAHKTTRNQLTVNSTFLLLALGIGMVFTFLLTAQTWGSIQGGGKIVIDYNTVGELIPELILFSACALFMLFSFSFILIRDFRHHSGGKSS